MSETTELLSKAAYARHRGVGKSAVSNWIKRGQIVLVGGKVDVSASDKKLGAIVDPASGRDPATKNATTERAQTPPETTPSAAPQGTVADSAAAQLASERLEEIRERRIGHALKNAEAAGELVPVAAFEARLQTLISGFCERMQSELRAQAEPLALETDKRKVRALLDDALHRVRSDFADQIAAATEEADEEDD